MGRFASTVPLYAQYRPPYPSAFFRTVAERLGFSKQHALIDLGTGPGLLALGFAPYVGRITGIDPEPAMIAAAKQAAARAAQEFTLIESTAERLPHDIGSFDVVTIGRALHWMDREAVAKLLDRLVAPDGVIIVCAARSAEGRNQACNDACNPWLDEYNKARRFWAGTDGGHLYRQDLAAVFQDTRFRLVETITIESSHRLSAHDLAQRMLTFSTSSPDVLGDKADAMLRDVEQRLRPFGHDGLITEIVVSKAAIAR